ncbi:MAG: hypothetical protein NZM29_01915, partial [Nitrospira sp.]|nr:hypothetical protein [Nitrospira sp.]
RDIGTSEPAAEVRLAMHRYLRALFPKAEEAESALQEWDHQRQTERGHDARGSVGKVVAHRSSSLSPDLVRQLRESAWVEPEAAARWSMALATVLTRLPPMERELLRRYHGERLGVETIAAEEGRSAAAVHRDLTLLHATVVRGVCAELGAPEPFSGGAADLGRMADQLLDGSLSPDGQIVLETLLLGDPAAQAHYARHVALAVHLAWHYRGEPPRGKPPRPDSRRPPVGLTRRERWVTGLFLAACVLSAAVVLYVAGIKIGWW